MIRRDLIPFAIAGVIIGSMVVVAAHGQQNNQNVTNPNGAIPVQVMGGTITAADPNNASYQSAGTPVASGALPAPVSRPTGKTNRGVQYNCGSSTPANSVTTLTLPDASTLAWVVSPSYSANQGVAATAATAVTGCTFQALY